MPPARVAFTARFPIRSDFVRAPAVRLRPLYYWFRFRPLYYRFGLRPK
jgi:hypothetical protein